jgi:PiT family inorganic phosphate transporter/sulfate permease
MGPIELIAIAAGIFLSINVGGNNSAAEMGPAFGAGVRSKQEAVLLIAVFSMIGAILSGHKVVATVASGIMSGEHLAGNFHSVIIILFSAAAIITLANVLRIPIATSHAMVGAVTGMGLFYGFVNWPKVGTIVIWWLATPFASLMISYLIGRYAYERLEKWVVNLPGQKWVQLAYRGFITVSGCYMAYSAGSNSLAKAVGPLVGAGIFTELQAAVFGGLGMAAGAMIVGHRLLHTVGKGITSIPPLKATLVELICGTLVLVSSQAGVPVSLAEIVTCSVIGFGAAHSGIITTSRNKHVKLIYRLWPLCPLITATFSFGGAWLVQWIFF